MSGALPDPDDRHGLLARLVEPFDATEVKWKPQMIKSGRALAIAYVDARVVQDRLDEVAGVDGWQDEYNALPDGSVVCRLRVRIAGEWVTKMDVGSPSEQPDEHDRMKAAFSDALKRAAVKFGVGRYLYRLPHQWCDYDPVKKQFVQTPQLPAFARPKSAPAQSPPPPPPPARKEVPLTLDDLRAKWLGSTPKDGRQLGEYVTRMNARLCDVAADYVPGTLEEAIRTAMGAGDEWTWDGLDRSAVVDAKDFGYQYLETLRPKG